MSAEGHRSGLDELADLGEFLTLAVPAHAAHHKHVAGVGPGRLLPDELHRRLGVNRRLRVGDAGHAREAAGERRPGAGLDGFILLPSRLPQVDVHVDQARGDDEAVRIDRLIDLAEWLTPLTTDRHDETILDKQVVDPVDLLGRIDDPATPDEHAGHQTSLPLPSPGPPAATACR